MPPLLIGLALAMWAQTADGRGRGYSCGSFPDDGERLSIQGAIDSMVEMSAEGWRSVTIAECFYLEIIVPAPSACEVGSEIFATGTFYWCHEDGEDAEGNLCFYDVLDKLTLFDCR